MIDLAHTGAVGDAVELQSVTTTNGSRNIADIGEAPWLSTDVGKHIAIGGAGASGAALVTTITAYTDSSHVQVADAASTTVTLSGSDSSIGAHSVMYTQEDTTPIRAAIAACLAAGGGRIVFSERGYVTDTLTLYENMNWEGLGVGATKLFLLPGSTGDLVTTNGFSGLTGTGSLAGVYQSSVDKMTLVGGRDWASSSGWCLRQFGYQLNHGKVGLEIRDGKLGGFYSEYGLGDNARSNRERGGSQSQMGTLNVRRNAGYGVLYRGAEDSYIDTLTVSLNDGYGLYTDVSASYAGSNLSIANFHSSSNNSGNALAGTSLRAGYEKLGNAEFEGAFANSGPALEVLGGAVSVANGEFVANSSAAAGATALQVGNGSTPVFGARINARYRGYNHDASPNPAAVFVDTSHCQEGIFHHSITTAQTDYPVSPGTANSTTVVMSGSSPFAGVIVTPAPNPTMGGDLSGLASAAQIVAGAVGPTELAGSAVTAPKIAAANVNDAHINGFLKGNLSGAYARNGGFARETYDRDRGHADNPVTSWTTGTLYAIAIQLIAGDSVGHIWFRTGASGITTPAHWGFALYDAASQASPTLVAVSVDKTNTGWSANSANNLAMTTPFTVVATGLHYVAIWVTAAGMPTIIGAPNPSSILAPGVVGSQVALASISGSGLTTAPPATITSPTAIAEIAYGVVT